MRDIILEVKNISKSFGPTKALTDVSLEIYRGEICGLIGENGSGKSTLSSILAGIQKPDSGEMVKDGKPYEPGDSIKGQEMGVAMIIQEAGSIPNISIADNIFAGKERKFMNGCFVNRKQMNLSGKKALEKIGVMDMDPAKSLNVLNQEDRKIVEIARAMNDDPDLLIVDETTTALSKRGRDITYSVMNKMKAAQKGVIIISHDIDEIMEVCDAVVVLRDGVKIGRLEKEEISADKIRRMMVGREMSGNYYRSDYEPYQKGSTVLKAEAVSTEQGLRDVSMELREGEILGIGGLTDSGMHDLGRVLFGIKKATHGKVSLADGSTVKNPWTSVNKGIGYVSKNRDLEALLLTATVRDNIVLASLKKISRKSLVSSKTEDQIALDQVANLNIKCSGIAQNVNNLSGGNKQKVVFGKWIASKADILILDCPTRGVDIGVKSAMYSLMYELKKQGKSMVMISEELPELIGMSDRILIMKNGEFTGEFYRDKELSEHDIIEYMI